MKVITPFNDWVITKILTFLTKREGFTTAYEPTSTLEGTRLVVYDAFGYQYEIIVRMTGRINNDVTDLENK